MDEWEDKKIRWIHSYIALLRVSVSPLALPQPCGSVHVLVGTCSAKTWPRNWWKMCYTRKCPWHIGVTGRISILLWSKDWKSTNSPQLHGARWFAFSAQTISPVKNFYLLNMRLIRNVRVLHPSFIMPVLSLNLKFIYSWMVYLQFERYRVVLLLPSVPRFLTVIWRWSRILKSPWTRNALSALRQKTV